MNSFYEKPMESGLVFIKLIGGGEDLVTRFFETEEDPDVIFLIHPLTFRQVQLEDGRVVTPLFRWINDAYTDEVIYPLAKAMILTVVEASTQLTSVYWKTLDIYSKDEKAAETHKDMTADYKGSINYVENDSPTKN